jgi:uncharacterized SAM-dependent methyltransferase
MEDGQAKAKRFRERAQQIRSVALDVRSAGDRKTLRAIAKEFEQLATDAAGAKP